MERQVQGVEEGEQGQGYRAQKKTSFESEHDGGIVRLAFTPVKGHSFWAEVIALAVCMYIRMGCGFRSIVNGLELFNDFLGGALGVIPSHQTIENWSAQGWYRRVS